MQAGSRLSSACTQTCRSSWAVSSAMMLAFPSLKPNRFRGVSCAWEVDDVRPNPSCDQRTRAVPNAARVRFGWRGPRPAGRRRGLDDDVPVRTRRIDASPGKCGARSGGRKKLRQAEPVGRLLGRPTNSDDEAEDDGGSAAAGPSPRRCPRRRIVPTGSSPSGPGEAARQASRHDRPAADIAEARPRGRRQVERRSVRAVLGRRDDAGLVRAIEGVGPRRGRARLAVRPPAKPPTPARPMAAAPPPAAPRNARREAVARREGAGVGRALSSSGTSCLARPR